MEQKYGPLCWCKAGFMHACPTGNLAKHPGRYYYSCLAGKDHYEIFIWCDVYHGNDPPERKPDYAVWHRNAQPSACGTSQQSSFFPTAPSPNFTSTVSEDDQRCNIAGTTLRRRGQSGTSCAAKEDIGETVPNVDGDKDSIVTPSAALICGCCLRASLVVAIILSLLFLCATMRLLF